MVIFHSYVSSPEGISCNFIPVSQIGNMMIHRWIGVPGVPSIFRYADVWVRKLSLPRGCWKNMGKSLTLIFFDILEYFRYMLPNTLGKIRTSLRKLRNQCLSCNGLRSSAKTHRLQCSELAAALPDSPGESGRFWNIHPGGHGELTGLVCWGKS